MNLSSATDGERGGRSHVVNTGKGRPHEHLLVFEKVGIRYTYLPKNGCTTMISSLLAAECDRLPEDFEERHQMARERVAGPGDEQSGALPLVTVARDPISRILSAYLDKFVLSDYLAARAVVAMRRGLDWESVKTESMAVGLSFRQFVEYLLETEDSLLDPHWAPQTSFLLDEEYAAIAILEGRPSLPDLLEWLRVPVVNASSHTTSRVFDHSKRVSGASPEMLVDVSSVVLADSLRRGKKFEGAAQFLSADVHEALSERYGGDLKWLRSLGGRRSGPLVEGSEVR